MATTTYNGVTYTLPPGVNNDPASIKAAQKQYGVTADGIWGPKSDAAYKSSSASSSASVGKSSGRSAVTNVSLKNGYEGPAYTENGNMYTDYGALIRNDDFLYTKGAKISPNGMYVDVGNGWQYAGVAVAFKDGKRTGYTNSSVTGLAPGTVVWKTDKSKSSNATNTTTNTTTATPTTTTPTALDIATELRKRQIAEELAAYRNKQTTLGGY